MSLADSVELARVIVQTITAILNPTVKVRDLITLEDAGRLSIRIHGVIDCRSLFDALASPELQIPSESGLILILAGLKEMLQTHLISHIWWVDTLSMLADGLNKGIVSRRALIEFSQSGIWQASGDTKKHQEVTHKPI